MNFVKLFSRIAIVVSAFLGCISANATIIGPVSQFQIIQSPPSSSVTIGASFSMYVTAEDLFGNLVPNYFGTVVFSSSDQSAVLPSAYSFTSGDNGRHLFNATLDSLGLQSISVRDVANGGISGSLNIGVVTQPVPEPETYTMLVAGLGLLGFLARRRQQMCV